MTDGQFVEASWTERVRPVEFCEARFPRDGVVVVKNLAVSIGEV